MKIDPAGAKSVAKDLRVLCKDIGLRLAGTPGERKGLEYVRRRFEEMGLDDPRLEPFEFDSCDFADFGGEAKVDGRRMKLMARPVEYATSTPRGGAEGEVVFMDAAARANYGGPELKGKIGLFLGAPLPEPAYLDAMQNSGLAAAIIVDHRQISRWPVALGFPEMWAGRIKMPLFSIPFEQAWALAGRRKSVTARLWVKSRRVRARSANALAELPGADKRLARELMYVSGHVDAVRDTVGANDNASGTVFAMEVARLLRETPLRRTVRFAAYGVEERLSVGSYRHYQNRAKNGMGAAVFGYNADSCGSKLGVNQLLLVGPGALERLVRKLCLETGYVTSVEPRVTPYSDQFALNMLGVPTVWVHRVTNTSGDWSFHSTHDNLDAVDAGKIAEQAAFAAAMLRAIDGAEKLPFEVKLPPAQWNEVATHAKQLIGIELKRRG